MSRFVAPCLIYCRQQQLFSLAIKFSKHAWLSLLMVKLTASCNVCGLNCTWLPFVAPAPTLSVMRWPQFADLPLLRCVQGGCA